jgi:hypothetical protein
MKHLCVLLLLCSAAAVAEPKPKVAPKVADCFKVHSLIRSDEDHYFADWTNSCPYTIDSVYVMVSFANYAQKLLGDGVWSLHFITPGQHRVTRLNIPSLKEAFSTVHVRKITTDTLEALR